MLNLQDERAAYTIGFLQGDGSHKEDTRNRGRISIEIRKDDSDILDKIASFLSENSVSSTRSGRVRNTNFSKEYASETLNVFDWEFRKWIKPFVPVGIKSNVVYKPDGINEIAYWRGIIDSDGSIGISKNNIPIISLVTASEQLKKDYCNFIYNCLSVEKNVKRNKRDNVYNILLMSEDAQKLCSILYDNAEIYLDRKKECAYNVLNWKRPEGRLKRNHKVKKWESWEDTFIQENDLFKSIQKLNRTKKSIETRLWRLKNAEGDIRKE